MSERQRGPQRGLGRGLSALLGEQVAESAPVDGAAAPTGVTMAPIESLKPNPDQPRKTFNKDDLDELAASIRDKGVLQPILVRTQPGEDGVWQIVAGERRWRAAQLARLTEAPIIVKEMDDVAVFEVAIIENVQRSDLNPLEEAEAFRVLRTNMQYVDVDHEQQVAARDRLGPLAPLGLDQRRGHLDVAHPPRLPPDDRGALPQD